MTSEGQVRDFEIITRSRSAVSADRRAESALERLAVGLLEDEMPLPKPVRLLGISLSSLQIGESAGPQLDFGL